MVAVPVKKDVLIWARNERGLSPDQAAARLGMPVSDLLELETGARSPSLGDLERISSKYQIALVSLLMPAPLPAPDRPPFEDFRAFDGKPARSLSPETLLAIEEAYSDLEMLSDLREAAPEFFPGMQLPFSKLSDDPVALAKKERERLGVTPSEQRIWSSEREAFLRWRELVESQGIFTYQLKLGGDDTRGFAIWDDREIAIIVIDAAEGGYPAKCFTLWHEYAHILLRRGGISNQNRSNSVERFCNAFAAHFLMPLQDFRNLAGELRPKNGEWTDWHITRIAGKYKTSKRAVAIHLETSGLASSGLYARMQALWTATGATSSGRATYPERIANRLGSRHVRIVLDALRAGALNKMDAREFLDVRPEYFASVEAEISGRRAAYGRSG